MRGESEFYPVPRAFPLLSSARFRLLSETADPQRPAGLYAPLFAGWGRLLNLPGRLLCLLQFFQIRDHIGDF